MINKVFLCSLFSLLPLTSFSYDKDWLQGFQAKSLNHQPISCEKALELKESFGDIVKIIDLRYNETIKYGYIKGSYKVPYFKKFGYKNKDFPNALNSITEAGDKVILISSNGRTATIAAQIEGEDLVDREILVINGGFLSWKNQCEYKKFK